MPKPTMAKPTIEDLLFVAGGGCVVSGVFMLHVPGGMIALGALLMLWSVAIGRANNGDRQ